MNSTILLPSGKPYRMAANNYYLGHARLLTMMALAMDAADDPPVNPSVPGPVLGNTLRSYLSDATGAWLYQEYAMFGVEYANPIRPSRSMMIRPARPPVRLVK